MDNVQSTIHVGAYVNVGVQPTTEEGKETLVVVAVKAYKHLRVQYISQFVHSNEEIWVTIEALV